MITEDEIYNTIRRTDIVVGGDCDTLAEKLHEEISSRICENCKLYINVPTSMGSEMYCDYLRHGVALDFSCNKFKRKDK